MTATRSFDTLRQLLEEPEMLGCDDAPGEPVAGAPASPGGEFLPHCPDPSASGQWPRSTHSRRLQIRRCRRLRAHAGSRHCRWRCPAPRTPWPRRASGQKNRSRQRGVVLTRRAEQVHGVQPPGDVFVRRVGHDAHASRAALRERFDCSPLRPVTDKQRSPRVASAGERVQHHRNALLRHEAPEELLRGYRRSSPVIPAPHGARLRTVQTRMYPRQAR